MTDTTAHEGYERVEWDEVRNGDVLFHENGDRLTVETKGDNDVLAAGFSRYPYTWKEFGFTPYRKQPELPTKPGAYLDKDGDCWLLGRSGNWYDWSLLDQPIHKGGSPQNYAPFTRLVPMPTEEDVLNAIGAPEFMAHRTITDDQVAAVMALLGGGDDA